TRSSWTALRPPLVYGAGGLGNMGRLEQLIRRGLPLPLGSVRNQRSVMYVGNLASAVLAALDDPVNRNRAFVVADHPPCSTPTLIRAIAGATGQRARLFPCPALVLRSIARLGDLLQAMARRPLPISTYAIDRLLGSLAVDDRGFRSALGWSPPIGFQEAVERSFGVAAAPVEDRS
ncbi:MAG: hypothetical protein KDA22_13835, partial [Phycisphaerales bacterium]|nr:hypothetical protein [Phycisphaerales bacterium]